jgi:DNA-binding winged helix-turn-helix (wHTH) protein/tetratricopeptide (TPR) repeat protein
MTDLRDVRSAHPTTFLHIGDWLVLPNENLLARGNHTVRLEPKVMEVLVLLAKAGGTVLSVEDLLEQCWRGSFYGDSPVRKAIAQIRKAVEDSPTSPQFLETVHKRGYRLIPTIRFADGTCPAGSTPRVSWVAGSPFRGLAPFQESHAAIFFGRNRAVQSILSALRAQSAQGLRFVLCVGASGSGKTSLLQAGAVSAIKQTADATGWRVVASCYCSMAHGEPFTQLTTALLNLEVAGEPLLHSTEYEFVHSSLRDSPEDLVATLRDRLSRRVPQQTIPGIAIVLDDLDGIFLARADVPSIVTTIEVIAKSGVFAVLAACRSDSYPLLARSPELIALKGASGHVDLTPPNAGDLAVIIRQPARLAGLDFEGSAAGGERLDDVILVDAISHPESLPLVQYTLSTLYQQRTPDNVLTFASYRSMGGLEGAIASQAEVAFVSLPSRIQEALSDVLGKLIFIESMEGASARSRPVYLDELSADAQALCTAFVDARLFVQDHVCGRSAVRPTHDALLRHWERITQWIIEHRKMLLILGRVRSASVHWINRGKRSDLLLPRGLPIEEGRQLEVYPSLWIEPAVRRFIDLSLNRNRRGIVLRRALIACLGFLAIGATTAGWLAWHARNAEERQREQAEKLIAFIVDDLNRALGPLGRIDLLDRVGLAVSTYLSSIPESSSTPASVRYQSEALLQLVNVRLQQGKDSEALELARKAQRSLEPLLSNRPDAMVYRSAGAAAYWIGYIHYRARKIDAAREAWEAYEEITTDWLKSTPADPEAMQELSYAINNLAVLERDRGDYAAAAERFAKSIALKRSVLAKNPGDRVTIADLADSLSWQGSVLGAVGRYGEASAAFGHARNLISDVRRTSKAEMLWTYREAAIRLNEGFLAFDQGELSTSDQRFSEAEDLVQQALAVDRKNKEWARALLVVRQQRAWIDWIRTSSRRSSQSLARVAEEIVELRRGNESQADLRTLESIARTHLSSASLHENPRIALTQARLAKDLLGQAEGNLAPEADQYVRSLSALAYGDALSSMNDREEALSVWRGALRQLNAAIHLGGSLRVASVAEQLKDRLGDHAGAASLRQELARNGFRSFLTDQHTMETLQ